MEQKNIRAARPLPSRAPTWPEAADGCCKNLGCDEDEQQIDVDKTSPRPSSAPTHHEVADDYSQDDKKR